MGLNEALSFLIDQRERNVELLKEACKPTVGNKEALEELQMERKQDELRLERKIGDRHQRVNRAYLLYCVRTESKGFSKTLTHSGMDY